MTGTAAALLGVAGAILAAVAFVLVRRERNRSLERLRARLAEDLHDDLGSSLSRIAILSEVVRKKIGTADAGTAEILGEISETARSLIDALGDAVWSVDPRGDTLGHVVSRMRRFAGDVLDGRGIKWRLDAADGKLDVRVGSETRRQLFLVYKEAVTNVARHSGARSAVLRVSVEDGSLTLEVSDDGRGFELEPASDLSSSLGRGRGLLNMKVRAARSGGKLGVSSAPGEGTRLVLVLPLRPGTK